MSERLKIAIQKKGRLSDDSLSLFKACGIKFKAGYGSLKASATNFDADFLFLRDDDIPGYVEDGIADIGIVGENVLEEKKAEVTIVKKLGFSKCRLSIAVPRETTYSGVQQLDGQRIATSYPNILGKFLADNNIKADIHEISGSVEIAPSIGLAEAICDIVSTGSTLLSNGLKEVEKIYNSEAVLVASNKLNDEKQDLLNQLMFRVDSVQKAKNSKYILLNAPNDKVEQIVAMLPGMKSPTVLPLAESGWSSIHSVLIEDDFWKNIENIRKAGAQGILVVPIEKIIN
ncbi:MAG: ATP phosphoribosyltransferase [Spirosomataceae bacterium]|jgi:ATP phosphoribosyltransferase